MATTSSSPIDTNYAEYQKAFQMYQSYIRSKNANWIYRWIFGSICYNHACSDAYNLIQPPLNYFKTTNDLDKYLQCLLLKLDIEKEIYERSCIATLCELGQYYTTNKSVANYKKAIDYYEQAIDYCIQYDNKRIFPVYEKIINIHTQYDDDDISSGAKVIEICELLTDKYSHILSDRQTETVLTILADKYIADGNFFQAFICYNKCEQVLSDKKFRSDFNYTKYARLAILCLLAQNKIDTAMETYVNYCNSNVSLMRSSIGVQIESIIRSIRNNSIDDYVDLFKHHNHGGDKNELLLIDRIKNVCFISLDDNDNDNDDIR